jgi:hypothetical protein
MLERDPHRAFDTAHRHFELDEQYPSMRNCFSGSIDVISREPGIRAERCRRLFAAFRVDLNHRNASRGPRISGDELDTDAFCPEAFNRLLATAILSDAADERHCNPESRDGHRLVQTFAAARTHELTVGHRRVWLRQPGGSDCVVRVHAAEDDDLRQHANGDLTGRISTRYDLRAERDTCDRLRLRAKRNKRARLVLKAPGGRERRLESRLARARSRRPAAV